jgi:hypothetical protein
LLEIITSSALVIISLSVWFASLSPLISVYCSNSSTRWNIFFYYRVLSCKFIYWSKLIFLITLTAHLLYCLDEFRKKILILFKNTIHEIWIEKSNKENVPL